MTKRSAWGVELKREWVKVRRTVAVGVLAAGGFAAVSALGVAQVSPPDAPTLMRSVGAGVAVATSVGATLSPILAIVFALISFFMEFRNRMWSASSSVAGSLDRMLGVKLVLAGWVGICLIATMVLVAVVVLTLQGGAPHVRASWLDLIGGVLLVPYLVIYWFILTSLVVSLVRPVALAGTLLFFWTFVEVPVVAALLGGGLPLPLSASLALYSLVDYPPGSWATPPLPVGVEPLPGAVAVLLYAVAGVLGTRSRMRVHLAEHAA